MRLKHKKLFVGGLVVLMSLFIQSCGFNGFKALPQKSCNFVQNGELQRVSWKDQIPVEIDVHNSVPNKFLPPIESAIRKWNRKFGKELFRIGMVEVAGNKVPSNDGTNMIYWLDTWENERHMEQARTTIYWTVNRIREADIRINAKDFDFYGGQEENLLGFTGIDMQSLMVHELGHALGLSHNDEKDSVMNMSLPSGVLRRKLGQQDLDSVSCEY